VLSGTFNLIDPNLAQRREGLKRLRVLAAACEPLGTSLITLCTGTRDPVDMWRWHPDNTAAEAWDDLLTALGEALDIAQTYSITLGIEPEGANVVYSARQARRLLDTFRSPHLKIVMDAANLFHDGDLTRQVAVIDEAFDLLGDEIVLAHAKDITIGAGGMEWRAAGQGLLDYDHYLRRLHDSGYSGPLILHGLAESQVAGCVAFLRAKLASYQ
jgi:sugar phosphate isomerase/epimerase